MSARSSADPATTNRRHSIGVHVDFDRTVGEEAPCLHRRCDLVYHCYQAASAVTHDRPAGLECRAPRGPDRRCRTRWADGCSPMPTDGTRGRSSLPGWAARQRYVERACRRRTRSCRRSPGCTSRNHRRKMVKKPKWLSAKGTQSEKCSVPISIRRFIGLRLRPWPPRPASWQRPCTLT